MKSDDINDRSEIAIISGKSKILVDYEYPITYKRVGVENELRRQIIFNESRNLWEPQDRNKVISMSDFFKGAIITGSFKINEKYLSERQKNNETENH